MRVLFSFLFFFLHANALFSQNADISALLKAWKADDTTQTHLAEKTYDGLRKQVLTKNRELFHQQIKTLEAYLIKKPGERIQVRAWMYQVLGKQLHHIPLTNNDFNCLRKAIMLTNRLADQQLMAELYTLYAQVHHDNNFLLYSLKAIELQQKIGFRHFSYNHYRFFNISYALYLNNEFEQSIKYGLKGLKITEAAYEKWNPKIYVYLLDMVGASHLKLGHAKAARHYYQLLLDGLDQRFAADSAGKVLWRAIAMSNIGHSYIKEGRGKLGEGLVRKQLLVFMQQESNNNLAICYGVLAKHNFLLGNYDFSIAAWKKALAFSKLSRTVPECEIDALKGIADSYDQTKNVDSSYLYFQRFHQAKLAREREISEKRLSVLKAQVDFDSLQANLEETNDRLFKERILRNMILIGIVFLGIIVFLLYNRYRLRVTQKNKDLLRKQKETQKEMMMARDKLAGFGKSIIEKDELIYALGKVLKNRPQATDGTTVDLKTQLSNYTLITEKEWLRFKGLVADAYPGFYERLQKVLPTITPAETRLASLICLGLNDRQIATMLGIHKLSVTKSKRRLKQRIAIPEEHSLESYICSLNQL